MSGRRRLCRRRRGHQTLPCSEPLAGERVAEPARSRQSQYARRGAPASQTRPFIAGATCEAPTTNHGRGPRVGRRGAGAEVRPRRTSRRGGCCRCEPVDEWRGGPGGGGKGRGWNRGWTRSAAGGDSEPPPGRSRAASPASPRESRRGERTFLGRFEVGLQLKMQSLQGWNRVSVPILLASTRPHNNQSSFPAVYLGTWAPCDLRHQIIFVSHDRCTGDSTRPSAPTR